MNRMIGMILMGWITFLSFGCAGNACEWYAKYGGPKYTADLDACCLEAAWCLECSEEDMSALSVSLYTDRNAWCEENDRDGYSDNEGGTEDTGLPFCQQENLECVAEATEGGTSPANLGEVCDYEGWYASGLLWVDISTDPAATCYDRDRAGSLEWILYLEGPDTHGDLLGTLTCTGAVVFPNQGSPWEFDCSELLNNGPFVPAKVETISAVPQYLALFDSTGSEYARIDIVQMDQGGIELQMDPNDGDVWQGSFCDSGQSGWLKVAMSHKDGYRLPQNSAWIGEVEPCGSQTNTTGTESAPSSSSAPASIVDAAVFNIVDPYVRWKLTSWVREWLDEARKNDEAALKSWVLGRFTQSYCSVAGGLAVWESNMLASNWVACPTDQSAPEEAFGRDALGAAQVFVLVATARYAQDRPFADSVDAIMRAWLSRELLLGDALENVERLFAPPPEAGSAAVR